MCCLASLSLLAQSQSQQEEEGARGGERKGRALVKEGEEGGGRIGGSEEGCERVDEVTGAKNKESFACCCWLCGGSGIRFSGAAAAAAEGGGGRRGERRKDTSRRSRGSTRR